MAKSRNLGILGAKCYILCNKTFTSFPFLEIFQQNLHCLLILLVRAYLSLGRSREESTFVGELKENDEGTEDITNK